MPIITFIIGCLVGLVAGMIIVAGSWRKALGLLGSYATRTANTPAAQMPPPAPKVLISEATPPEPAPSTPSSRT